MNWESISCKRLISLLTDYTANGSFADLAKNVTYLDEGYARLIRLTDLRVNMKNKGAYVSENAYEYLKKSKLFGGEFLIANVGAYAGFACKMPYVDYKATLAPNMMMARFIDKLVNVDFIIYAFNCPYVQYQLKIKADNTAAQPKINKDDFKTIKILIPPRNEQDQIVRYLDWKVSEINWLIAKKHMQHINLTLYRIKLNNDLMNKVNGEYVRFKNVFSLRKGLSITKEDLRDEGVPCVNYGEIHSKFGFEINSDDVKKLKCVDESYLLNYPNALLKYGDFVIADTSEDIKCSGAFTYLNNHTETFAGYHTIIASSKIPINHRFIAYYFDSEPYRLQIWRNVNGVKVYSITQSILNNTLIKFPSEEDQNKIVSILDEKGEKIDFISNALLKEIDLLKEYRTRLISDVVTGKLDVGGVVVPEYEAVENVMGDEEMEEVEENLDE